MHLVVQEATFGTNSLNHRNSYILPTPFSGVDREPTTDTLRFTLNTVTEVSTLLSLMNCRTHQFETGAGDWEKMDELVEDVDSRMETAQYDWKVFKEHYEELREEQD